MPKLDQGDIEKVLTKIEELRKAKAKKKVDELPTTGLQPEDVETLRRLFEYKDSLDGKRDAELDARLLRYTQEKAYDGAITDTDVANIAQELLDTDFAVKVKKLGDFLETVTNPERRDEISADIYGHDGLMDAVKKAHGGKFGRKENLYAQAKEIEQAFEDSEKAIEKELQIKDRAIAILKQQRTEAQAEVDRIKATLAELNGPASQTITDRGVGGQTAQSTHIDSPDERKAKQEELEKSLNGYKDPSTGEVIKGAQARLDELDAAIKTAEGERGDIERKIPALNAQKRAVMQEIYAALQTKGISRDGRIESSKSDKDEAPVTSKSESETATTTMTTNQKKEQEAKEAEDYIQAINVFSDQEMLEHLQRGDLDKIVDAKSRIKIGSERRTFDMKITSLLEKEVGKLEAEEKDDKKIIKIRWQRI